MPTALTSAPNAGGGARGRGAGAASADAAPRRPTAAPGPEEGWPALERLFATSAPRLRAHLFALTGDADAVDDLLQETMVTAWRSLGRFEGRSGLSTWVFGIAVQVARNYRATRGRRRSRLGQLMMTLLGDVDPLPSLEARNDLARLQHHLRSLPDALQEAFVIRNVEAHSIEETAAILGIPVSTAYERAVRAQQLLRRAMHHKEATK